jgi:hypothetical protein
MCSCCVIVWISRWEVVCSLGCFTVDLSNVVDNVNVVIDRLMTLRRSTVTVRVEVHKKSVAGWLVNIGRLLLLLVMRSSTHSVLRRSIWRIGSVIIGLVCFWVILRLVIVRSARHHSWRLDKRCRRYLRRRTDLWVSLLILLTTLNSILLPFFCFFSSSCIILLHNYWPRSNWLVSSRERSAFTCK